MKLEMIGFAFEQIFPWLSFQISRAIQGCCIINNLSETAMVKGTLESPIMIGDLSGYMLVDETGSILVVSEELPGKGEETVARGELKKEVLICYHIDTDK